MPVPIVTVFGGSGFIGRYVTQRMARAGWRVRVAVRRPSEAGFVRPYGVVGQVEPIQANIRDEASTRAAIAGRRGGDQLRRHPGRDRQADLRGGARRGRRRAIARHLRRGGGRAASSTSPRSAPTRRATASMPRPRAEARRRMRRGFPGAVILRPSIVFGDGRRLLQPVRRDGADLAGPADHRRRRRVSSRSMSMTWRRRPPRPRSGRAGRGLRARRARGRDASGR